VIFSGGKSRRGRGGGVGRFEVRVTMYDWEKGIIQTTVIIKRITVFVNKWPGNS